MSDVGEHVNGETMERTVLFADIVDSTGILRDNGEEKGRELLIRCLELMTKAIEENGGIVEDRIGDELFCLFEDPDACAHAASQMQQRVVDGHAHGELSSPMRVRIGLEHGTITRTGDELYGTTIHAAKRLVDMAKAGQILTSKNTLELLSPLRRRMERYFDSVVLKGLAEETDVHELLWDTSATMVPTGRPRPRREKGIQGVLLRYDGREVRVDANLPRVTLGRDTACHIRLKGNAVSRVHARVSWNRGKASVEDVSTNGTCVEAAGGASTALHHEGVEIQGSGVLRFGCLGREEDAALVEFTCV